MEVIAAAAAKTDTIKTDAIIDAVTADMGSMTVSDPKSGCGCITRFFLFLFF